VFSVNAQTERPWYEADGVNRERLDAIVREEGTPVNDSVAATRVAHPLDDGVEVGIVSILIHKPFQYFNRRRSRFDGAEAMM
jgi:hypothetical protein